MALSTPPPSEVFFRGRLGDLRIGEWVDPVTDLGAPLKKREIVIIGYPDDQGVKRNRGRAGADKGPDSIRRHLYKMTVPADRVWEKNFQLFDLGNALISARLGETHQSARELAAMAARHGRSAIALGGGHDFAAPTFQGFHSSDPKARWGLINVDPHLDAREMEGSEAHSGNPFRVLLEEGNLRGSDFVEFGARSNRNSRSSWEYCLSKKVSILTLEKIREHKAGSAALFQQSLLKLTKSCKFLGLTIDMDTCCDAEGTSAAPVLGFSASELVRFAAIAGKNPKVRYLEIAEVAPPLDPTERSSRIAAEVVSAFLSARSQI